MTRSFPVVRAGAVSWPDLQTRGAQADAADLRVRQDCAVRCKRLEPPPPGHRQDVPRAAAVPQDDSAPVADDREARLRG
ncbi:hypothetical protein ON010_g17064 [Phytophthora cinnamomi]|nr:hypothetical protein ON010_g17064 [Phytophthora cinnamomi]